MTLKSATLVRDARTLDRTFESKVAILDAPALDSLIAQLGELRSRMLPGIATDQAQVQSAHPIGDFYFRKFDLGDISIPVEDGALLLFQSPRFGWFQLPAHPALCSELA